MDPQAAFLRVKLAEVSRFSSVAIPFQEGKDITGINCRQMSHFSNLLFSGENIE